MLFSRWKVMTGLVGVSLGGIAALAGQLPKADKPAAPLALPEVKPTAPETPKSANSLPPPVPTSATQNSESLPALPHLPDAPSDKAPVKVGDLPTLPLPEAKAAERYSRDGRTVLPPPPAAVVIPSRPRGYPPVGNAGAAIPTDLVPPAAPSAPRGEPTLPTPMKPTPSGSPEYAPGLGTNSPVVNSLPPAEPRLNTASLPDAKTPNKVPQGPAAVSLPEAVQRATAQGADALVYPAAGSPLTPPVANPPLLTNQAADPLIAPSRPSAPPAATKFRIVLRVGDGEPSFEVRHGDNLVMKVTCDKVDIKSPEKGQGSNVTATGKVKFVGFGAEGTCDSLSFLAGSGEVALSGNVNVKVRDKIGRVESELNAEKMQYKLDQTALTGLLKP